MADLQALADALIKNTPQSRTVDEMAHSGGAGISFVERWAVGFDPRDHANHPSDLWVWRVMWAPLDRKHTPPTRIAYGVVDGGQEAAQAAGRKEARRLAKTRRETAA